MAAGLSSLEAVRRKIRSLQEQADRAEEQAGRLQRELDEERALREQVSRPGASEAARGAAWPEGRLAKLTGLQRSPGMPSAGLAAQPAPSGRAWKSEPERRQVRPEAEESPAGAAGSPLPAVLGVPTRDKLSPSSPSAPNSCPSGGSSQSRVPPVPVAPGALPESPPLACPPPFPNALTHPPRKERLVSGGPFLAPAGLLPRGMVQGARLP